MSEINARDEEIARMRNIVMSNQDEMKLLTVSREQFRKSNEKLQERLDVREKEVENLKKKIEQ